MNSHQVIPFAKTDYRNDVRIFGMYPEDRRYHKWIIGKTGSGKSTLIKHLAINDMRAGHGVAVIDPHGDLVQDLLDYVPKHRTNETVLFNPHDRQHPIGFNVLEYVEPDERPLIASQVVSVFQTIWSDSWGPRLEFILKNAVLTLLDVQGATLVGIPRLLTDKSWRQGIIKQVRDPLVRQFWEQYDAYAKRYQDEIISPIQNKVGKFLNSPDVRNILGQKKSTIDFKFMMDNQRILLCDLSKGKIGEDNTKLLGSLIVSKLYLAALQRVNQPEDERQDFYLYIDESQTIASPVITSILSEARKYRLNLIIANQYIAQMDEHHLTKALLGNVGTLIAFRVGPQDARVLGPELTPDGNESDLVSMDKYQIRMKMVIKGVAREPFSAVTLPPLAHEETDQCRQAVITTSRQRYTIPRQRIEKDLHQFFSHTRSTPKRIKRKAPQKTEAFYSRG